MDGLEALRCMREGKVMETMLEYSCERVYTAFRALMDAQRKLGCIGLYPQAECLCLVARGTAKLLSEVSDMVEQPDLIEYGHNHAKTGEFCLGESLRMLDEAGYAFRKAGDAELAGRVDKQAWEVLGLCKELDKKKNRKEEKE